MFKKILTSLFLFPIFQIACFAQTGGISFAPNGSAAQFRVGGSGQDIALRDDKPFSLLVETSGNRQSYKVDKISTVSIS